MNAIDVVLVLLVIVMVTIETKRGFGKVMFDFVALVISVRAVSLIAPKVAGAVHFAKDAPANEAIWFGILFVVVGGILVYIGKLIYDSTLFTLDTFDPFLGGVLGFGVAIVIGHVIVRALAISSGVNGAPPDMLAQSRLGIEFYDFTTYHKVIDFLSSLTT